MSRDQQPELQDGECDDLGPAKSLSVSDLVCVCVYNSTVPIHAVTYVKHGLVYVRTLYVDSTSTFIYLPIRHIASMQYINKETISTVFPGRFGFKLVTEASLCV